MAVRLATAAIKLADQAVRRDQGSAFRGFLGKVLPHIGDAYRTEEDGFRSHMGASIIGGECARKIWYDFRWATKPLFSGQTLRLFNRGHLEEGRFIALLLAMGCEVYQQDANGKQFRISHAGGHFGGSGDGVVIRLPDLVAGQAALLEFKTHNLDSFTKLAGKNWRKVVDAIIAGRSYTFEGQGVRAAKFEHYVQMQIYMRKMGLPIALYGAVNKNTDDIYFELVPLDIETADKFLDRGEQLVHMDSPPKKLSESPGFFSCAWCDHKPVCHLRAEPERNCRTCEFSKPKPDGQWTCLKFDRDIPKDVQLTGCPEYARKRNF